MSKSVCGVTLWSASPPLWVSWQKKLYPPWYADISSCRERKTTDSILILHHAALTVPANVKHSSGISLRIRLHEQQSTIYRYINMAIMQHNSIY